MVSNIMKRLTLAALIVYGIVCSVSSAVACPACKDGYTAGSKQAAIGEAYSMSVLFMLGVPMTIVAVAGIAYARHMRKIKND